jgi:hypothetical protein
MKRPTAVTDQRLSDYSGEHVLHELNVLWQTAAEIAKAKERTFASSVLLESFVVHLRTLIEFFYYGPKQGYVRAKDFFPAPHDWDPKMTDALTTALDRANGEASHLTWSRQHGTPAEKEWKTAALLAEIEAVAKDFCTKALATRLHPGVRTFLGLPSGEKTVWLIDNVQYSNVASQALVCSSSDSAASTATTLRVPAPHLGASAESGERDVIYVPISQPSR